MKLRMLAVSLFLLAGICSPAWAIYCNSCGNEVADGSRFCNQCGQALSVATQPADTRPPVNEVVASYPTVIPAAAPQAFQVTSHYLQVGGYRIYRNSFFWIAEVSGSRARVWSVNEPPYSELVMGWVALSELEKRSTLKPSTNIYCVEPPPPTAKIVVVETRSYWQRWGFFSGPRRGRHDSHHSRRRY